MRLVGTYPLDRAVINGQDRIFCSFVYLFPDQQLGMIGHLSQVLADYLDPLLLLRTPALDRTSIIPRENNYASHGQAFPRPASILKPSFNDKLGL